MKKEGSVLRRMRNPVEDKRVRPGIGEPVRVLRRRAVRIAETQLFLLTALRTVFKINQVCRNGLSGELPTDVDVQ